MAASYVVIETGDPFGPFPAGADPLIGALAAGGATTVVLTQNAVLAARRGAAAAEGVSRLATSARLVADEFALRERGIRADELVGGVAAATADEIVDLILADGCRAIWH